jgi:hypothetical protein
MSQPGHTPTLGISLQFSRSSSGAAPHLPFNQGNKIQRMNIGKAALGIVHDTDGAVLCATD